MGLALLSRGYSVRLFDVQPPQSVQQLPEGAEVVVGDIRKFKDVDRACQGVAAVIHIASYGMSGREQLHQNMIYEV